MRRRFWLSRRSAEVGVGRVAVTVERLQQHLMGRDVYLSSRGYVSTDSHGWRRHVGFVGGVAAAEAGNHWVVEVETTEEYEARQHEVVGGVATGRQDLDAVEEIRRQLEVIATVAHAEITRGFNASMIHDQTAQAMGLRSSTTLQPGQIVYATDNGTVTATPSQHSPVVGTFVRAEGNNAVVALHGGGTAQVGSTATARDVAQRTGIDAVATTPRSLFQTAASSVSTFVDVVRGAAQMTMSSQTAQSIVSAINASPVAMQISDRQFTAISYTDRTEVAEVRSTSPMPVGYTVGSYTADIPITIHGDLDDLAAAMQRQSRELRAAARRRQDETTTQALTTSRPVRFPIAGPITDERTRRISELVERVSREAAQRYLGELIQVDPHTTHITEPERRRIEEGVTTALRQRLDGDIRLVVDREMRAGQLQTRIVGSTTGEHSFTSSFDSGDVWSRAEPRRTSMLIVDDILEETTPAQQEQMRQLYTEWARPYDRFTQSSIGEQVRRIVGTDCMVVVTATQPGHVLVTLGEDRHVHDVARHLQREKPVSSVVEVAGPTLRVDCDRMALDEAVVAFATGTVRITNTSPNAYTIAPGALAVSSSPDVPTTWYNVGEMTLPPGGVVEVPVHSMSSEASPSQITHVRSPLPGVMVSSTTQPCTYAVDAVEVSPDSTCAPWLSRLLPWLGSAVAADDAELRRLDDEVAATGQLVLVYVAERRALRVETRREWIAAGGGRMAWSTICDRAAVLS